MSLNDSGISKSKVAAHDLVKLFDSTPVINAMSEEGRVIPDVRGHMVFSNVKDTIWAPLMFSKVHFRYPTRPEVPVLRGLNMEVKTRPIRRIMRSQWLW